MVDKVRLLCVMNGEMMRQFSARTAGRLKDYTLFKLLLPPFQKFLDINVTKEIEKDRLVITRAAESQRAGRTPLEVDINEILQKAREIDRSFLELAAVFPVNIRIEYHDIEPTRQRRIERQLAAVHRLLAQWERTSRFRAAMANIYTRDEFEVFLREILQLYSSETRLLSHSVSIPEVFNFARNAFADIIYSVMVSVAAELSRELTGKVYRRVH